MNNEVALTIFEQIGGNRFCAMTGTKVIPYGDSLLIKIPRNLSKANWLRITLNGNDLYDMEFNHIPSPRFNSKTCTFSEPKTKMVKKFENVFFDHLQNIFTEVTGMYTTL